MRKKVAFLNKITHFTYPDFENCRCCIVSSFAPVVAHEGVRGLFVEQILDYREVPFRRGIH